MSKIDRTGTVIIKEGTPLPTLRSMESETVLARLADRQDLDRQALDPRD